MAVFQVREKQLTPIYALRWDGFNVVDVCDFVSKEWYEASITRYDDTAGDITIRYGEKQQLTVPFGCWILVSGSKISVVTESVFKETYE